MQRRLRQPRSRARQPAQRVSSSQACHPSRRIPKLREGSFFPEDVIERHCRIDRALVAAVAEMYDMGISTRKVQAVVDELGISSMSKSQVSRMCSVLDSEVAAFRARRFDDIRLACLWLDATYVKCRVDGHSVSQAIVTAIALDEEGRKRMVGVGCIDAESYADWKSFLNDLREHGIGAGPEGVQMVISDEHAGLVRAISETFQGASHQRCVTHLMRNVASHMRKEADKKLAREVMKAAFAQKVPLIVRASYQLATEEVLKVSKSAGKVMLEAEDEVLAYLDMPSTHRTKIRTNNVQERANREIKRRTRVVQGFPSRASLIRLVTSALIEAEEEWSARCVISKPSLSRARRRQPRQEPTEEQVVNARRKAREIIGAAIDALESES